MPASPQSVVPERVNSKIMRETEEYIKKEIDKAENEKKRFEDSVKFREDLLRKRGNYKFIDFYRNQDSKNQ